MKSINIGLLHNYPPKPDASIQSGVVAGLLDLVTQLLPAVVNIRGNSMAAISA
jgi:hypothetical protein